MSVRPIKGKKDTWQIETVIGYNSDGSKNVVLRLFTAVKRKQWH